MSKKNPKTDENDFEALDKLAHNITPDMMRPLSPGMCGDWEAAKRAGRGRPPKSPGSKAVPTMITVEPKLLKLIDREAKKSRISRSQFLAEAAKAKLGLPGAA